MNGVWLHEKKITFRSDLPLPTPGSGQALLRVRLAGICSTDLEMVKGYYPYTGIAGHEFVGEVAAVLGDSAEESAWVGKRVVSEINFSCGQCAACRAGNRTHCLQRKVLGLIGADGAFAGFTIAPIENLHCVPESVPDDAAVFTEPLAAALEILEQVSIRPSQRVLVVGAGRLGLLAAQALRLTGCSLAVVARRPLACQLLAGWNINVISQEEVRCGEFDLAVEATGSPSGFTLARHALRPRGTLVLKSTYAGELTFNASSLVVDEITLVGSRCGPFAPALELLASGRIDPTPMIQGRYALAQADQAFEHAARPGALKILLTQ